MRRAPLVFLFLVACSGGGDGSGDDDGHTGSRDAGTSTVEGCGIEGTPEGTECVGFDECGVRNTQVAFNCDTCPQEAISELCLSGRCTPYDLDATIQIGFNVFEHGDGANSFVLAVIDPMGADGTRVTCEALLSSCNLVDNFSVNVMNVQVTGAGSANGFEQNQAYIGLADAQSGEDRIAYLRLHAQGRGNGTVLAKGCSEWASLAPGQTAQVLINLIAP